MKRFFFIFTASILALIFGTVVLANLYSWYNDSMGFPTYGYEYEMELLKFVVFSWPFLLLIGGISGNIVCKALKTNPGNVVMKKILLILTAMVLIIISVGASITIGVFISEIIFKNHKKLLKVVSTENSTRRKKILKQLIGDFQKDVSMKNCVNYDENRTVGDMIGKYLNWMMESNSYGREIRLTCVGEDDDDMETCRLLISESSNGNSHQGWGLALKFDFNSGLKEIRQGSYECDVYP